MSFDFTEENLGKGYKLLEQLMAQCVAHEMLLKVLIRRDPSLPLLLQEMARDSAELLQAYPLSDQSIKLLQDRLLVLANSRVE